MFERIKKECIRVSVSERRGRTLSLSSSFCRAVPLLRRSLMDGERSRFLMRLRIVPLPSAVIALLASPVSLVPQRLLQSVPAAAAVMLFGSRAVPVPLSGLESWSGTGSRRGRSAFFSPPQRRHEAASARARLDLRTDAPQRQNRNDTHTSGQVYQSKSVSSYFGFSMKITLDWVDVHQLDQSTYEHMVTIF